MPTYRIAFELHDLALGDVMRTGCVGAERLWLNAYRPEFETTDGRITALRLLSPGGTGTEYNVPAVHKRITYQSLADALGIMAVTKLDRYNAHLSDYFARIMRETSEAGCAADMTACDTALQVAVFGYVAYG